MQLNTQQQGAVSLAIDGTTVPGPWQMFEGDEVTADVEKVWPGHMSSPVGLSGPPAHADVTLTRTYDLDTIDDIYQWLKSKVSSGKGTFGRQMLRSNKQVRSVTPLTGVLTGVSRSDYDSSSGSATQLRLTFSVDG